MRTLFYTFFITALMVFSNITVAKEVPDNNFIFGKFNPAKHPDFVKIGKYQYLQKETYNAFKSMRTKAKKDGVYLNIVSATRTFNRQKNIWERKWTGKRKVAGKNLSRAIPNHTKRAKEILKYSAMPGTSRHHWGTDIDIYSVSSSKFNKAKGKKIYTWLVNNAANFGFCQPYTAGRVSGYNEEKWHWSYIKTARNYTDYTLTNITNEMITGFLGSSSSKNIDVISNYIFEINRDCL